MGGGAVPGVMAKEEQKRSTNLEMKRFFYPNSVDDQKKGPLLILGRFFDFLFKFR